MTLDQMQEAMNVKAFSVMDCARSTGLHPNTIYRIKQGKAKTVNHLTAEALKKYLKKVGA